MATVVKQTINGHDYLYRVEYLGNDKQKWDFLGKPGSVGVDPGPIPDSTSKQDLLTNDGEKITLTGDTQNLAGTSIRWAENRAVIGEGIDEHLVEKITNGEDLTGEEAVKAEIAVRGFARYKQDLADRGESTIMGDPDDHEEWAEWARDAADDIDTGDPEVEDVLTAAEFNNARVDSTAKRGTDPVDDLMHRASSEDVSVSPSEAFGEIGNHTLSDGTEVKRVDASEDKYKEQRELEQNPDADTGHIFTADEKDAIREIQNSSVIDRTESKRLREVRDQNLELSELTDEQAQAIESGARVLKPKEDGEDPRNDEEVLWGVSEETLHQLEAKAQKAQNDGDGE